MKNISMNERDYLTPKGQNPKLNKNISKNCGKFRDYKDAGGSKVTWGTPAQITQSRLDRQCPCCNSRPNQVEYEGNILINGFEISQDGLTGLCYCGFSFDLTNVLDELKLDKQLQYK